MLPASAQAIPGGLLRAAILTSGLLLLLRLHATKTLAFGDSEALYASYALFPQPAYVDHPGLIGVVARWIGDGGAPSPQAAHTFSSMAATALPWLGAWAARAAGASAAGSLRTLLALALAPEMAIGLFGFCPDLLLSIAWIVALGLSALAVRLPKGSLGALGATLGAGLFVGVATMAKVSGALLGLALLVFTLGNDQRWRWKTLGAWAALAAATVLVLPLLAWEATGGAPMVVHRLITTQAEAGFSLRNLGALLGGQLLYVTPPFLIGAWLLLKVLHKTRASDPILRLLWLSSVVPAVPLLILCLWSKQAEPHWIAPAYLSLAVALAKTSVVTRTVARSSVVVGALVIVIAWTAIATPLPVRVLGASYRPRFDISNDMYAWGPARSLLLDALRSTTLDRGAPPVVVGPHWTVCAQAQAALGHQAAVGCNTPLRDDFDRWLPRQRWLSAPSVLFVYDDRFPVDPRRALGLRTITAKSHVRVRRGGQTVRTVYVVRLDKPEDLAQPAGGSADNPAAASIARSKSGPALGVVSRVSP